MYLESKTSTITTKVDTVCYKMLTEMNKNPEKYILPIVSCLVKSSKSKVDDALLHIQSLKSKISFPFLSKITRIFLIFR